MYEYASKQILQIDTENIIRIILFWIHVFVKRCVVQLMCLSVARNMQLYKPVKCSLIDLTKSRC